MVGNCKEKILQEAFKILNGEVPKGRVPELWDGKSAERIVEVLLQG
jgi:UDP-N-acetylglucosamine 2-epimerase (non-hydrolysing)